MADSSKPAGPPPEALAMDMVLGGWKAQALVAFVKAGLADLMSVEEFEHPDIIAKKSDLNPKAVQRLLRFLATTGVCEESESGGHFKLGPVGEVCAKSNPKCKAGCIALEGSKQHTNLWANLSEYLKTGKKVTNTAFGHDLYWDMCASDPDHLKVFQEAMTSYTNDEASMMKLSFLSPTLDLTGIGNICDLGCAEGALALALNERFPDNKYILADLQEAVDRIDESTLPSNFEVTACDFLKQETIPVADAYLLKHIVHDWNDEKSIEILSNIKSTNPKAKVFIMEFGPMPGPNVPHLSKIFDLHMAITLDGYERSQEEYNALFSKSGFQLVKAHLLAEGNHPLYVQEIS